MSLPTEFDFALIKMGDGATPTEVFTTICGLQDATLNETVNTNDRFVRDCTKPGEVPQRRVQATGKQTDITGTGLTNADNIADVRAALGVSKNYQIEVYQRDGTDEGSLLGTFAGAFVMTSSNLNVTLDTPGSAEITLASDGALTYTAAP
ncbi:major tail protein [Synechococcus phage Yong-M3-232]|nr:major tail protein [Synechococcus phage Yong-M3-232]